MTTNRRKASGARSCADRSGCTLAAGVAPEALEHSKSPCCQRPPPTPLSRAHLPVDARCPSKSDLSLVQLFFKNRLLNVADICSQATGVGESHCSSLRLSTSKISAATNAAPDGPPEPLPRGSVTRSDLELLKQKGRGSCCLARAPRSRGAFDSARHQAKGRLLELSLEPTGASEAPTRWRDPASRPPRLEESAGARPSIFFAPACSSRLVRRSPALALGRKPPGLPPARREAVFSFQVGATRARERDEILLRCVVAFSRNKSAASRRPKVEQAREQYQSRNRIAM